MTCLTFTEYLFRISPQICSTCRKHIPVNSRVTWRVSLVEHELLTLLGHLSSPGFSRVVLPDILFSLWCFVDRCLSFYPFTFDHCVICPSSIYGLPLPFGIFKLFLYLMLYFVFKERCWDMGGYISEVQSGDEWSYLKRQIQSSHSMYIKYRSYKYINKHY